MSEEQINTNSKEECPKEEFPEFHGYGPRCHGPCPMGFGKNKCKERKCECGEVITKRK